MLKRIKDFILAVFQLAAAAIVLVAFIWIQRDFEDRRYGGRIVEARVAEEVVIATVLKDGFERRKEDPNSYAEISLDGTDAAYAQNRFLFFLFLGFLALGVIRTLKLSNDR